MNDDYDKHIIQKYRLAVAVAIINNTPENSTPNKYLEVLRNNIIPEMEPYDPDMTICEDDFYDDDNNDNDKVMNDLNANNETQFFDSQANDSITILKDFNFNDMMQNINDSDIRENNSMSDVLKILKGVGNEETLQTEVFCSNDGNVLNHTQSIYCENSQNLLHEPNLPLNKNIGQTQVFNSEILSIPGAQNKSSNEINDPSNRKANLNPTERAKLNDSQEINSQEYTDNFTHVSQSQDNIVLPKYFIQKDKSKENKTILPEKVQKNLNEDRSIENKSILHNNFQIFFNSDESKTVRNNISENKKIKQIHGNTDIIIINDMMVKNDNKKHKLASQDKIDSTQAKRYRNVDNNIAPDTDTAYFNEIKNNFNMNDTESNSGIMMNTNSVIRPNEHFENLNKPNNVTNSFQGLKERIDRDYNIKIVSDNNNFKRNSLDNFGSQTSNDSNNKANKIAYNSQSFSQFSQEFDSEPNNTEVIEVASNSINLNTEAKEESEEEQIIDLFNELTDSQAEVVPFKVLEELSKVKAFLNKQKRVGSECASDSGYKSDSQSRSSFKRGLQSSNIWLNQSAHCLLNYISQCPLIVSTEDIINEISKTLGRLIDRLHEEEKYPSFLEELLQTVDALLKGIYEEESADKILQKDENICRLFLLNKSSHIMKYTTEKIISILEELNTILTNDELLEASRTVQTENLSYIFHILEILIKKLVVHKNLSQKSTQNSQEDEIVLKRSSIADIWRKKWNPDKKCVLGSSGGVKECVLVRCGEVLNKLIVQAMDGYSLISYFALQCFNLLQN